MRYIGMGESVGTKIILVEVRSDHLEAKLTFWAAAAKPDQAISLVLSFVPAGWTAEIVDFPNDTQFAKMKKMTLKLGEVRLLV